MAVSAPFRAGGGSGGFHLLNPQRIHHHIALMVGGDIAELIDLLVYGFIEPVFYLPGIVFAMATAYAFYQEYGMAGETVTDTAYKAKFHICFIPQGFLQGLRAGAVWTVLYAQAVHGGEHELFGVSGPVFYIAVILFYVGWFEHWEPLCP